jgi:hypothetical protein
MTLNRITLTVVYLESIFKAEKKNIQKIRNRSGHPYRLAFSMLSCQKIPEAFFEEVELLKISLCRL